MEKKYNEIKQLLETTEPQKVGKEIVKRVSDFVKDVMEHFAHSDALPITYKEIANYKGMCIDARILLYDRKIDKILVFDYDGKYEYLCDLSLYGFEWILEQMYKYVTAKYDTKNGITLEYFPNKDGIKIPYRVVEENNYVPEIFTCLEGYVKDLSEIDYDYTDYEDYFFTENDEEFSNLIRGVDFEE